MEDFPCTPNPECKYFRTKGGCYEDIHHVYYPGEGYRSATEKVFRNLPQNKELMCRRLHELIHTMNSAPPKPPQEVMREAITLAVDEGAITLSATKHRRIYGVF